MTWRDDERPDIDRAAEQTQASKRQADADLERARALAAAEERLRARLAELNASNGFAELLVDAVVRGSA